MMSSSRTSMSLRTPEALSVSKAHGKYRKLWEKTLTHTYVRMYVYTNNYCACSVLLYVKYYVCKFIAMSTCIFLYTTEEYLNLNKRQTNE